MIDKSIIAVNDLTVTHRAWLSYRVYTSVVKLLLTASSIGHTTYLYMNSCFNEM